MTVTALEALSDQDSRQTCRSVFATYHGKSWTCRSRLRQLQVTAEVETTRSMDRIRAALRTDSVDFVAERLCNSLVFVAFEAFNNDLNTPRWGRANGVWFAILSLHLRFTCLMCIWSCRKAFGQTKRSTGKQANTTGSGGRQVSDVAYGGIGDTLRENIHLAGALCSYVESRSKNGKTQHATNEA